MTRARPDLTVAERRQLASEEQAKRALDRLADGPDPMALELDRIRRRPSGPTTDHPTEGA